MKQMAGSVAIVTGASKGMGRHFVGALVEAGMRIACLARTSPELESLAAEFGDEEGARLALRFLNTFSRAKQARDRFAALLAQRRGRNTP